MNNDIDSMTTSGTVTQYSVGSTVTAITAGSDGALWFTDPDENEIGRITTSGTITDYPIPTSGADHGV